MVYDRAGGTLAVWFQEPTNESVAEEAGEEVVLMKDRAGQVIGFERLNFAVPASEELRVSLEAVG